MELHLQFGWGMMELSRALVREWGGGTVLLSPKDLKEDQLLRLGQEIAGLPGGRVLLDPQFYLPNSDHERLKSHRFWPAAYDSGAFWQGSALEELIRRLVELNDRVGCQSVVLPGLLATEITEDWMRSQEMVLATAQEQASGRPLTCTVALAADALRDQSQVSALIERAERWNGVSFYLVCEHPRGTYLVDDPVWLANVLDISAALRMQGAHVTLGYCNHQMLVAGCAKVSAIASGTWMNVRSFPPDKFRGEYEEDIRQRATWYYCAQALSEYKMPFLDIAQLRGVLGEMAVAPEAGGGNAASLFRGAQPSSVGFNDSAAFRHYLNCVRYQCSQSTAETYDEAVARHQELLDNAERLLARLRPVGVRGQIRDFSEIIDVNRAALGVLDSTRGPMLRRLWSQL